MITVGQILPNGATVLDISYKATWYGGCRNKDYYVLCKLDDSKEQLYPFATWWIDPARPESTSSGNYSQSFSYAMDDFIARCGHINERGLNFHREK